MDPDEIEEQNESHAQWVRMQNLEQFNKALDVKDAIFSFSPGSVTALAKQYDTKEDTESSFNQFKVEEKTIKRLAVPDSWVDQRVEALKEWESDHGGIGFQDVEPSFLFGDKPYVRTPLQKKISGLTEYIDDSYGKAVAWLKCVDEVCNLIFGFKPADMLIRKPFAGDWDQLEKTADQWETLVAQTSDFRSAMLTMYSRVHQYWEGAAAAACKARMNQVTVVLETISDASAQMESALRLLANCARQTVDLIMDIIDFVVSILKYIAGELAVPVIGEVAALVTLVDKAVEAVDLVTKAVAYINDLSTLIQQLGASSASMAEVQADVCQLRMAIGANS